MYSTRVAGFSAARIIVIIVIILGIITAILTGAFFLLKEQKTTSAKAFTNTVISSISKGDSAETFENLDSSLKNDESAAYYNWLFWTSSFTEGGVTISDTIVSSEYTNASPGHLVGNGSVITITYSTSVSSKVSLTAIQQDDGWKIMDYASV